MFLFSSSKKSYLGVDLGTGSIKLVELSNYKGRAKLETYGYIDMFSDILKSNSPQAKKKIAEALKTLKERSGVKSNKCVAALPTFSVFSSIISLPELSKRDLASAIRWEAKKYIPLPLEEMILDWKIITEEEIKVEENQEKSGESDKEDIRSKLSFFKKRSDKKRFIKVLITAAPKNLVSRYLEIFKMADLKLLSLETEAFALARCLIGHDQANVMIIDIGSVTSDICIIEKGIPFINRSLDTGGLAISQAIASSLNISLERAEQFKRDYGISLSQNEAALGIPKIIEESITPIINEVKYIFDLYQKQGENKVEKIIMTGGSVFLPNLEEYFSQLFGLKVFIGNAWERIIYPIDLKPVLEEVGSRLAVAIGLALREIY